MEGIKKRPKVDIGVLLVIVVFTVAGFFIGVYYARKNILQESEPVKIAKHFPAERHLEILRLKTGWQTPEEKIIDNLVSRPDLIPEEPVLGGTMGFYNRDEIFLLNDKWVLAAFEDGHIGGFVFLEYEISEELDIKWELLSSYLE